MAATPTPNMLHGKSEYHAIANDEWKDVWHQNNAFFHSEQPNPFLVRNESHLIDGRQNITIFFPLCGKVVDMKRLYDLGHQIVGVELSEMALEQFFQESQLEYSVKPVSVDGKLYQTTDGRIRLYCMDLFEFTNASLEKDFDGAWDRGSLEAINLEDREKYAKGVLSVSSKDVRYLVSVTEYNKNEYCGPPHPIFEADLKQLFGDSCVVKMVEKTDIVDTKAATDKGMTKWERCVYLITRK